MVQAARSGVQNIAEGSLASATSKKTEIKLTNVARASLTELLLDYEDFLRQRGLVLGDKESADAARVRQQCLENANAILPVVQCADPATAANSILCLGNQASFLLGRQIQTLERQFIEQGGFTERMHAVRTQARASDKSDTSDLSDKSDQKLSPACPKCGKPMTKRAARQGPSAGQAFWGCTGYPDCRGTREV